MAEFGVAIASKLIEVFGSDIIRELSLKWGYKSQLDDLKHTFTTVRNVLLDAESKDGQLGHEEAEYIRQLKDAVYDIDDLFDEVLTRAELKKRNKGDKLSIKVRHFFSSKKNSLRAAYSTSLRIENIIKKLEGITSNHNTFGLRIDSQSIRKRREETCSYVYKDEVIGREADVDKVVKLLLDSGSSQGVSFASVVGVGGLGKTTLAQLVYNDDRVKSEFPLRLWTCVSDENTKDFDVKKILMNILELTSREKVDGFTMDLIQGKLGDLLGGKKFLIVLDDLWNEDRNKWLGLKKFLMVGGIESRVLVTTRSKRTAIVVGENSHKHIYELKGLSPDDSWRLFEMMAYGNESKGTQDVYYSELVKLGKHIFEKCYNVPLAIRVVGTLLYGQHISKWLSFEEYSVAKLNNGDNEIMSILKLSYDNLESPLKACFIYCSLFPKNFRIGKEQLISLWMAQGYIVPFNVGQSLEDAAEEYLSTLLRRCFFQEVQINEFGGIVSFKIHDLFHDLAQKLAGKNVVLLNSITNDLSDDVHHIFHIGFIRLEAFFRKYKIRSYVHDGYMIGFSVVNILQNLKFLRTLDLHNLKINALPNSIGKLLHLRYLDLSHNYLFRLPDSITNLYNLQTLNLNCCTYLGELPMDFSKLVNLRYLGIHRCDSITHMPSSLEKLSSLCVLSDLVVAKGRSDNLESLRALTNLRGCLQIRTSKDFVIATESNKTEERYLGRMKYLEELVVKLFSEENHGSLLERLEPPPSVKALELYGYNGAKLPTNWYGVEGNLATLLPNLVRVWLYECSNLVHLPSLSKLLHLKSLRLDYLRELEYVEDIPNGAVGVNFFPSLEFLQLSNLDNIKGWWKSEDVNCNTRLQPCFTKVALLIITDCAKLSSCPICPRLERLICHKVNNDLLMSLGKAEGLINLKRVELDNLDYLNSLPTDSLTSMLLYTLEDQNNNGYDDRDNNTNYDQISWRNVMGIVKNILRVGLFL